MATPSSTELWHAALHNLQGLLGSLRAALELRGGGGSLDGEACAEIVGTTEAHAKGARGHVDCMEIVQGRAQASAIPIVRVFHPEAKVTHEAAIGSVDKKELETLMARGLAPEEAIELIVSGILR